MVGLASDAMRWTVHGERSLYDSEWVRLAMVDVEIPAAGDMAARRFDHHVVRSTAPAAGTVVSDPDRGVLLLWRHRFITDSWGWEVPAGRVDAGETSAEAAAREVLEESGWRPGPLTHLVDYFPINGIGDQRFDLYLADGATHVGDPSDPSESERVEWLPVDRLREEVRSGRMTDGISLTSVSWALAFGLI